MPNWGTEETQKRNHHPAQTFVCVVCGAKFSRRTSQPVLTCSKACFGRMQSEHLKGLYPTHLEDYRGKTAGWNKGKPWSSAVRRKISDSLKGKCLLSSPSYKTYRKYALLKFGYRCQRCGWDRVPQVLTVHHRDGNRMNNDYSNLEVLCPNCHCEIHWVRGGEAGAIQESVANA